MEKSKKEPKHLQFEDFLVGATLDGDEITNIYAKNPNHVIFRTKGTRSIRYRWNNDGFPADLVDQRNEAIAALEASFGRAETKFKGEKPAVITSCIVASLRQVLKLRNFDSVDEIISKLDLLVSESIAVTEIFGRGKNYCVWINEKEEIHWRVSQNTVASEQAISEFIRLRALAEATLSIKYHARLKRRLAAALVSCLHSPEEPSVEINFGPLKSWLIDTSHNEVKLKLLLWVTVFSTALMMVGLLFYCKGWTIFNDNNWIIVVTAGVAGALISFLERSKSMVINVNELPYLLLLSNVSRIALGGLFGIIAYSAIKTGVAFSIFKGSKYGLLLVGVAAGFSERLIPDLIGSITSEKKDESSAPSKNVT